MDQTQLQQKIAEYYVKLPEELKMVFAGMSWMENLRTISQRYLLNEEQIETIGTETTLTLLGITSVDEYENTIKSEIKIPEESMDKMIIEINDAIFNDIRPQLSETFTENTKSLFEEKYGNQNKLDERFSVLPIEVQKSINESNYQQALYIIAQKHKLSIDQMSSLEETTTRVLLGLINPVSYENALKSKLNLPAEEITEIVQEVNDGVLKNIREILKTYWNKNDGVEDENDEIPIPPYKTEALKMEQLTPVRNLKFKDESEVYANSGIQMVNEDTSVQNMTPEKEEGDEKMTIGEDRIIARSGINIIEDTPIPAQEHMLPNEETQKNMLMGIENPDRVTTSIIGNKLRNMTISKNKVSDYSIPRITGEKVPEEGYTSKLHDPYHEEIV